MKPKEKAQDLIDKYIEFTQEWDEIDGYVIDMYNAKQCALIAVDEILNELDLQNHILRSYWYDVQNEINQL